MSRWIVLRWFLYVGLLTLALYPFCIGPYHLEVTRHERAMRYPGEVRVAHLTDLHLEGVGLRERWAARAVAGFSPDLILITGDSVSDVDGLVHLRAFLGLLSEGVPVFGVNGNWEWSSRIPATELREIFAATGGRYLVNETDGLEVRGIRVGVTGMDDPSGGSERSRAFEDARFFPVKLLAIHRPSLRDEVPAELARQFDLALAGHTHGGQVKIFGKAPLRHPDQRRYLEGWHEERNPPLYVNRGVGTSVLPVRFDARPEVALIRLAGPEMGGCDDD